MYKIYISKETKYVQSSSLFPPLQEHICMCCGEQASSLSILYKSWHRASFMIFQPKFYCGCYKIICLNNLHSPSQRNINGELSLPLMFCNRAASYRPPSGEAIMASQKAFSFSLFSKRSIAPSLASNLASAFFLRSSATSEVSTLVPLSASAVCGPGPAPFPFLRLFCRN